MKVKFTTTFHEDFKAELKKMAKDEGIPVNELIEMWAAKHKLEKELGL